MGMCGNEVEYGILIKQCVVVVNIKNLCRFLLISGKHKHIPMSASACAATDIN